jgi:ubiquinone biosynthesis UbiH/UbiF/VisC/COQ6 family hydroxylase
MMAEPRAARRQARRDVDVLVVGGGVVGAATAVLLATQAATRGLSVGLVEPRAPVLPAANADWDLRVFALSRASQRLLEACGVWPQVLRRAHAYQGMRVWDSVDSADGPRALTFTAGELGEPELGHLAEVATLQAALHAAAMRAGVRVYASAVESFMAEAESAVVTLADGTVLRTGLVVAAEGADSPLREAAGIAATVHDYHQRGVVAFLRTERSHEDIAWQRFLPEGPLALLPVAAGRVSIVWTLPTDHALRVMAMDDATFEQAVTAASDGVLGELRLDSARTSFPLRRITAAAYGGTRLALVGDAAHAVHPLAGQGANLGLLDAAALVQTIAEAVQRGEDIGDPGPLGRYARWRRAEAAPLTLGMHALQQAFTSPQGWLGSLRRQGLGVVAGNRWLRRQFMTRAMGLGGEAPRLCLGKSLLPEP